MARNQLPHKERDRHLKQYAGMTDEEYDKIWEKKNQIIQPSLELEKRINEKMEDFARDYDLDDLKINDTLTLRALIQALISLEDLEQSMFQLRAEGLTGGNIIMLDKLGKEMSQLRGDITNFQNDLKITRKIRKSEQETSVLNLIETLKVKAREYYQAKMMYIVCPRCSMLLSTIWTLYPEQKNKIELICDRTLDDGSKCGEKVVVYTKDLLESKGTNKQEVLPESLL